MQENQTVSRPKQLWNTALKAVKGDNTNELVEQFTAEMTLVAEGLCEDQSRVRSQVEALQTQADRSEQRLRSEMEALERTIEENERDTSEKLDTLSRRLDVIEKRAREAKESADKKDRLFSTGWMRQATLLVAIAVGGWVLVTVLNLLK